MTAVYFYRYGCLTADEMTALSGLVSEERREKIGRLKVYDKKCQTLFAGLLLRAVLCRQLNVTNGALEFSKTEHGKPFCVGTDKVHFSISHTESAVAIAVSESEIGVDIERVRPVNIDIAKRYFTDEECEYILNGGDRQNERFMFVWTRKEAYVKKSGVGFKEGFKTFSVLDSDVNTDFDTYYVDDLVISESGDMAVEFIGNDRSREILERFIEENSN